MRRVRVKGRMRRMRLWLRPGRLRWSLRLWQSRAPRPQRAQWYLRPSRKQVRLRPLPSHPHPWSSRQWKRWHRTQQMRLRQQVGNKRKPQTPPHWQQPVTQLLRPWKSLWRLRRAQRRHKKTDRLLRLRKRLKKPRRPMNRKSTY